MGPSSQLTTDFSNGSVDSSSKSSTCSDIPQAPLVASCHHLLQPNGSISGIAVAKAILPVFPSLASAIPTNLSGDENATKVSLASIDGRSPISLERIHSFITNEFGPKLHELGYGRGDRIALVLPNGPELALAILSIVNWASCVPLNAFGSQSELEADLKACRANVIIGPHATDSNDCFWHIQSMARKLGVPFVGLSSSKTESGIFDLIISSDVTAQERKEEKLKENNHDDEVIVLFTSGTTGNKKLVPHVLADMLVAAATIALSWNLTPRDVNCNLMPLFHVGGIVRQVFSPVLSGGCVICCPAFDPTVFWSLHKECKFSWYYAAPTMHQVILQTGKEMGITKVPKLRMIANAAGGLLPSLARELRETFGANVLPSYGMTECMPISSPPSDYQLEKPGTSGVAVGPEIIILDTNSRPLTPMTEGSICVRGFPCFRGYGHNYSAPEQNSVEGKASFLKGGWFNTGDLGYLDKDGYLYITGRSKEVINRGGEIISPLEIEEAVLAHPGVKAAVAFSVGHAVLQEVVGIVVVPVEDRPRVDLHLLHEFLGQNRLTPPKWPQFLVFMDGLPKSATNKLLRVGLGKRLDLPEINDKMHHLERIYEAICPQQGTSTKLPIASWPVSIKPLIVQNTLQKALISGNSGGEVRVILRDHPNTSRALVCYVLGIDRLTALNKAENTLHHYEIPTHFVAVNQFSNLKNLPAPGPNDTNTAIKQGLTTQPVMDDALVDEIQAVFQDMLELDMVPHPDSSFFNLGGSSMMASLLAARLRKQLGITLNGAEIFQHASCTALARLVRGRQKPTPGGGKGNSGNYPQIPVRTPRSTRSQKRNVPFQENRDYAPSYDYQPSKRMLPEKSGFCSALFQSMPLVIFFPLWQISRFFLFVTVLFEVFRETPDLGNWYKILAVFLLFHFVWITLTPLILVLIKWIVIGKYRAGRYPIYGSYYYQWWFVEVCRKVIGRGIFGTSNWSLRLYYRMMGANIGKGAIISPSCDFAEYDLITIGSRAMLDTCVCRGFAVDNGGMLLGRVTVGKGASVGIKSIVPPNTVIPDDTHLGPHSSSYDISKSNSEGCIDPSNVLYNRMSFVEPNLLVTALFGHSIVFAVRLISQIPPLLVFYFMISTGWHNEWHDEEGIQIGEGFRWFCSPYRIPYYIGIRVVRKLVSPIVYMFTATLVKWIVIGKFEVGPRGKSQYQLIRYWLAAELFSRDKMQAVVDIIGRHYELVSCMYRLLGAKIGKRVFWPGTQILFTGEFDLLEIGDDVVFGSRTAIMCGAKDRLEKVRICAGGNASDNCVVLPGATIGKNAVLGSYGICPAGWYLPESSLWFASHGCEPVLLEQGVADREEYAGAIAALDDPEEKYPMVGDESTLRPFGKAFYLRKATYCVFPLVLIIFVNALVSIFLSVVHAFPLVGALHGAAAVLYGVSFAERDYGTYHSVYMVFFTLLVTYAITHLLRVLAALTIETCAKWMIIGQRQKGQYNYDQSSYNQRWELFQMFQKGRRFSGNSIIDFLNGSPFLSAYFRCQGAKIGKDCCLYPTGGDPYPTELCLVTIGDRVVIDKGRVVCHLNTSGNFELNPIVIDSDVTMRQHAKIQMGVHMERGSIILEHSLAMTGEIIDAYSVWQGTPAVQVHSSNPVV